MFDQYQSWQHNDMTQDYALWQSDYIANNLALIQDDIELAHSHFVKLFPKEDSTWSFYKYNIFALTAPSLAFYEIYKELKTLVLAELGTARPLWFQAWINHHSYDQLLQRHHHEFDYHGYISIDPKATKTVFDDYEIINKPGQFYFGPGNRYHSVEALEPFEGVRTTIGFDIHTLPKNPPGVEYIERPFLNMSMMPLL
jgi:hypothetical protein